MFPYHLDRHRGAKIVCDARRATTLASKSVYSSTSVGSAPRVWPRTVRDQPGNYATEVKFFDFADPFANL
jgi:hypothetical protein